MPEGRAVIFAASAVQDLKDIRGWYQERNTPDAGLEMLADILAQAERLAVFPESGRVVPELGLDHLREIVLPPLRIVYRNDRDRVRIVRVWRSERVLTVQEQG